MKAFFMICFFMLCFEGIEANNIQITNASLTGQNASDDFIMVKFDLSWENSWRISTGPSNWDAAWVFVKYRVSNGNWQHALLHNSGHNAPIGSTIASSGDGMGVFIHRSENNTNGTFNLTGVQLRWNYGLNGLGDNDSLEVKVFGIEMVYIPQGGFVVGSGGNEEGSFTDGSWRGINTSPIYPTIPFSISSESPIRIDSSAGNLWGTQKLGATCLIGPSGILPAEFPKGYAPFYCMKYEISQQQYVDFLNTLTRTQQNTNTHPSAAPSANYNAAFRYVMPPDLNVMNRNGIRCAAPVAASGPITFYCDLNGNDISEEANDGKWLACNYLNWMNLAAYLDWSALRPMTELEYEKTCRGPRPPVANEYPWGNATISNSAYTLINSGAINEEISANYSSTESGNASYANTTGMSTTIKGPLRVGVFAANPSNTGIATAGAAYYGVMEMAGNVRERAVSIGNIAGRSYTGKHGDGKLNINGNADVDFWPGINGNGTAATANTTYGGSIGVKHAAGAGFRGGDWGNNSRLNTSARNEASYTNIEGDSVNGGRGVRGVP
jgi:formylglycine-generating enzyme required for sulfatase activity